MRTFNKLYGIPLLSLLLSVAACTSETEEPGGKPDSGGIQDGTPRRVMPLRQPLRVKSRDSISTSSAVKPKTVSIPIRNVSVTVRIVVRYLSVMM